MGFSSLIVLS